MPINGVGSTSSARELPSVDCQSWSCLSHDEDGMLSHINTNLDVLSICISTTWVAAYLDCFQALLQSVGLFLQYSITVFEEFFLFKLRYDALM